MAGRERGGADLIHAIQARFRASESPPRSVEETRIEAFLTAADSKRGLFAKIVVSKSGSPIPSPGQGPRHQAPGFLNTDCRFAFANGNP